MTALVIAVDTRTEKGRDFLREWIPPQLNGEHQHKLRGFAYVSGLTDAQVQGKTMTLSKHSIIEPCSTIDEVAASVVEFTKIAVKALSDTAERISETRAQVPVDYSYRGISTEDRAVIDAALDKHYAEIDAALDAPALGVRLAFLKRETGKAARKKPRTLAEHVQAAVNSGADIVEVSHEMHCPALRGSGTCNCNYTIEATRLGANTEAGK